MPTCPAYVRCKDTTCFMFDSCPLRKYTPYHIAMKEIRKMLGFLIARPWCTWEIMDKVFPRSVLQHPEQREECLGDLLEALDHSGFIPLRGSENELMWEWKPGYELRLKMARMDEKMVYVPRSRSSTLPEWMLDIHEEPARESARIAL